MKKLVIEATMLQFLPHLQAIKIDETQVIFSRTNNIGYIENGILFLRPEYLPGAAKNNVFIDQDLKILQEALKLSEIITEAAHKEKTDKRTTVLGLLQTIKASKSLDKIQALALEAANAGSGSNDNVIVTALNEIADIVTTKQNEVPPAEEEKKDEKKEEEKKEEEPKDNKKKTTKKKSKAEKKASVKKAAKKKGKKK